MAWPWPSTWEQDMLTPQTQSKCHIGMPCWPPVVPPFTFLPQTHTRAKFPLVSGQSPSLVTVLMVCPCYVPRPWCFSHEKAKTGITGEVLWQIPAPGSPRTWTVMLMWYWHTWTGAASLCLATLPGLGWGRAQGCGGHGVSVHQGRGKPRVRQETPRLERKPSHWSSVTRHVIPTCCMAISVWIYHYKLNQI